MLVRRVALTLRLGATVIFFAAIALIIKPGAVATFFGYGSRTLTPELLWTLRIMGVSFFIPALLGPLLAAFAGERGLRQAAAGLAFISLGISTTIFFSPGRWAWGKLTFAGFGYLFSLLYFYALRGRGRNR
jgi:hypothetical protein